MSISLHLPRLGHGRHHPAEVLRRLTGERDRALIAVDKLRADLADANKARAAAHARSSRLAEVEADNARLREENTRLRAALANAQSVTVAEWVRVVDEPVDVATQPIPASDMWNDTAAGWRADRDHVVVVPLPDAVDADTQEIPRPHAA